jgi:hypothetical protein
MASIWYLAGPLLLAVDIYFEFNNKPHMLVTTSPGLPCNIIGASMLSKSESRAQARRSNPPTVLK